MSEPTDPPTDTPPADLLARARDASTPATELAHLARHEDAAVRLAVAANPATPRAAIEALLESESEQDAPGTSRALAAAALGNPSVALWLLERPTWLHEQPYTVAAELARSPALTPLQWDALSGHASPWVKAALLGSPAAPSDAWSRCGYPSELDALLQTVSNQGDDPVAQQAVVATLAHHPDLPDRLSADPAWLPGQRLRVARALARSPALTLPLWQALRAHEHVSVRLALLRSPVAPPDAWARLGLPTGGDWDLSNQHLDNHDVVDLAARPPLAAITGLNLSSNEIGNPGVVALAGSPFVSALTWLDLSETWLSHRGREALARSTRLPRLARLLPAPPGPGEAAPRVPDRPGPR